MSSFGSRMFERAIAAEPEDLKLGADYRQLTLDAGLFDRAIDFFRAMASRPGSGPNVKINLALAYADKVPPAGDIRRLYLGRDAMNALTRSIAERPSVLAYYFRGRINLYYNRFIFHRTDKGVADPRAGAVGGPEPRRRRPSSRVCTALGDESCFRLPRMSPGLVPRGRRAGRFPGR